MVCHGNVLSSGTSPKIMNLIKMQFIAAQAAA